MKKIFGSLMLLSGIAAGTYSSAAEEPRAVNDSHFVQANSPDNTAPIDSRKNIGPPNAAQNRNRAPDPNSRFKRGHQTRRKNIEFPRGCDYKAGEFYREKAGAAALEKASRDFPKDRDCDYGSLRRPAGSVNLIEFNDRFADAVKFYRLSAGKYLVQEHCNASVYNVANLYLLFDETRILPKVRTLKFPTLEFSARNPNEKPAKISEEIIGGRRFNRQTKDLIVFIKGRGLGGFGESARYAFPNGKPRLKEFRARLEEGGVGLC